MVQYSQILTELGMGVPEMGMAATTEEYALLLYGGLSPSSAARHLLDEHLVLRTFPQVLREIYSAEDVQFRLTAAFTAGQEEKAASAARKVRNWLTGKNQPTSREDVFRIAFALDLDEAQASTLLGFCTEYGIHYREGREMIYAWFLRMGLGYSDAVEFFDSLPPCPRLEEPPPQEGPTRLTQTLHSQFLTVLTQDALRQTYLDNIHYFGTLHARAFRYFRNYMDQLLHPVSYLQGEEDYYSLETVMDIYFSMHMPSGKDRSGYSVTQKLLKRNWPNATILKDIYGYRKDVPRKLLLLLYVITENCIDRDYSELDEGYITAQERIEDHWWTMNAILSDCGMPLLDLRNASDWLIMYAVTADEESMSERLEQVIDQIFSDSLHVDP